MKRHTPVLTGVLRKVTQPRVQLHTRVIITWRNTLGADGCLSGDHSCNTYGLRTFGLFESLFGSVDFGSSFLVIIMEFGISVLVVDPCSSDLHWALPCHGPLPPSPQNVRMLEGKVKCKGVHYVMIGQERSYARRRM